MVAAVAVVSRAMAGESARDRILGGFLALAAERGMAQVTTREIARAAGVNEMTLFRHFGDKATLALEAVPQSSPAAQIDAYQPAIDTTSPERGGRRSPLRFARHDVLGR